MLAGPTVRTQSDEAIRVPRESAVTNRTDVVGQVR